MLRTNAGLASLCGLLVVAGCGPTATRYFGNLDIAVRVPDGGAVVDLAGGPGRDLSELPGPDDLSMPGAPPDFAMRPDFTVVGGGNAPTGDPCVRNTDCQNGLGPNQTATCIKSAMLNGGGMLTYPGGYCSSPCRTARNDPNNNGINSDCPGGNGTCQGTGATGNCIYYCQSSQDCRADYSCFVVNNVAPLGCLPTALSECDPTMALSCPPNMGSPQTCVNIGDGTVGACVPGCNPFSNTGCPGTLNQTDCHASDVTGEGLCTSACTSAACQNGTPAGSACGNFYSDCPGGYGCLAGKCWKYCNTGNVATQCSQGATCNKFSANTTVPTTVAGICSKSN